jgi:hypothetical protein
MLIAFPAQSGVGALAVLWIAREKPTTRVPDIEPVRVGNELGYAPV